MPIQTTKMSNYRWVICSLLFLATMVNYMDRQVLSLTWKDYISPEFGWNDDTYGLITGCFSIVYAVSMLFMGKYVDRIGTKRGFLISIVIWSTGAILHAFCGIATSGILADQWFVGFEGAKEALYDAGVVGISISTVSIYLFMLCRIILAVGQSGSFPAAIKCTAEYFPKKDRAYATAIFNNGASVGAMIAPIAIPLLATGFGWEMSFIAVGAWGYLWMLLWLLLYKKPEEAVRINQAERNYINQDSDLYDKGKEKADESTARVGILRCLTYRQTWFVIMGKFLTDGVWWFFLFWTPAYLSDTYGYQADSPVGILLIVLLYLITMISVAGGYLPTYFVNTYNMHPYNARMKAMLVFAFFPLLGIFVHPVGTVTPLLSVLFIGLVGAAHQSWSANIYSAIGDFFPKSMIATVTGIGGFAGGIGAFLITYAAGNCLSIADDHANAFSFFGTTGKQGVYMAIFSCLSVLYLIDWCILKGLVYDYRPVVIKGRSDKDNTINKS